MFFFIFRYVWEKSVMQVYKQFSMDLELQLTRTTKSAGQMKKGQLDIWGKIRVPFTFIKSFAHVLSVLFVHLCCGCPLPSRGGTATQGHWSVRSRRLTAQ